MRCLVSTAGQLLGVVAGLLRVEDLAEADQPGFELVLVDLEVVGQFFEVADQWPVAVAVHTAFAAAVVPRTGLAHQVVPCTGSEPRFLVEACSALVKEHFQVRAHIC